MAEYHLLEQLASELLSRFPRTKAKVKYAYQYANYLMYGDSEFEYSVHSQAELYSPQKWFGRDDDRDGVFFGYYDASPLRPAGDQAVFHQHRSNEEVTIVRYSRDGVDELATSTAWNYQQGSRLQWLPGHDRIVFNDFQDGELVAHVLNKDGKQVATYDRPVQSISPTGEEYVSLNYHRIGRNRPDYGYDYDRTDLDPEQDGLWIVDVPSGQYRQVVSLADLIHNSVDQLNHYLNHVLYNPSGERFVFLHRWYDGQGRSSRLYDSASLDSPVVAWKIISHYCWLNDAQLLVWGNSDDFGRGYHVINLDTNSVSYLEALSGSGDGHPSVSPNGRWIVTDTYPNRARERKLLLYDRYEQSVTELGRFFSPLTYTGPSRCDLHPRWGPDGSVISLDSTHQERRNTYFVDVSELVAD